MCPANRTGTHEMLLVGNVSSLIFSIGRGSQNALFGYYFNCFQIRVFLLVNGEDPCLHHNCLHLFERIQDLGLILVYPHLVQRNIAHPVGYDKIDVIITKGAGEISFFVISNGKHDFFIQVITGILRQTYDGEILIELPVYTSLEILCRPAGSQGKAGNGQQQELL